MMPAISFALQAFTILPDLIKAGVDIYEFIDETKDKLKVMGEENRDPTDLEWDILNARIAALRMQLD